ncbi:uncharacterized protein Dmoj_GI26128, isoform C [Drosophila mojavensis]|uniref:Uncharacterized protein, isoform B n=1 Tax=Drosophila mojavensis TaxID=7230 RepID=A0A0Q9XQ97_DROMO|nr:uncharacterized protein Dmoj_GI26128, isoform B [Drosophila mojavensis]KRG07834.1 uncharacterized protein Dmoj_GI26128, isoform C [Drosophila mojavensis]
MGRRNLKAQLLLNGRASPAKNMQPVSAASATSAAAAPSIAGERTLPRRRGRPRKNQLNPVVMGEESVYNTNVTIKVMLRSVKEHKKLVATVNNGFARGLKPDIILAAFPYENDLMFALKFKNRKLPELITAQQLKKLDISLLIQYYVINLRYPHNERPTM